MTIYLEYFAEKIFSFLKAHWGWFFLLLVTFVICAINFHPGTYIVGNDNFSPEINPEITIERSIFSPAWRDYRGLGLASDTEQSDLFRTIVFAATQLFVTHEVSSQLYRFFAIFAGVIGVALLVKDLFKRMGLSKYRQTGILFGGLTYLFSLLTYSIFYFQTALFVAAWAFFPIFLYFSIEYLFNHKRHGIIYLGISYLFLSTAALTLTMMLVLLIVWVIFLGIYVLLAKKKEVEFEPEKPQTELKKRSLVVAIVIFVLSSFWLLPAVPYFLNNSGNLQSSVINRAVTPNFIENEASYNNIDNTMRFAFSWMDTKLDGVNYAFPARDYFNNPFVKAVSYIPLILAALGLFYGLKRRKYALALVGLVYLLGLFLVTGRNSPFADVYVWMQDNIALFRQVLRWQSSKLWPFLIYPLTLLVPLGVVAFSKLIIIPLPSDKNKLDIVVTWASKLAFLLLVLSPLAIAGYPLATGVFTLPRYQLTIPTAYTKLADYLKKTDNSGRIWQLPEANTLYFRNHNWASPDQQFDINAGPGFWGSTFLNYLVKNPILDKSLVVGSPSGESAVYDLIDSMYAQDPNVFPNLLHKYDVKYLLLDRSNTGSAPGYQYDFPHLVEILNNSNYELAWEEGDLSLFEVKEVPFTTAVQGTEFADAAKEDMLQADDSISAQDNLVGLSTSFAPLAATNMGGVFSAGYYTNIYNTQKDYPNLAVPNFTADQFNNLPVLLSIQDGTLTSVPAVPELLVNGKRANLLGDSLTLDVKDAGFIGLGDTVVSLEDLKSTSEGKAYNYPYYNFSTGVTQFSNVPTVIKLQDGFVGKTVTQCSGTAVGSVEAGANGDIKLQAVNSNRCFAFDYLMYRKSVQRISFTATSSGSVELRICIYSTNKKKCLNDKNMVVVQGTNDYFVTVPSVVDLNDDLVLNFQWISLTGQPENLLINNTTALDYPEIGAPAPVLRYSNILPQGIFSAKKGDLVTIKTPILFGKNTYHYFDSLTNLLPEFDARNCILSSQISPVKQIVGEKRQTELSTLHKGCEITFYPQFQTDSSVTSFAGVAWQSENFSGIPLDISLVDAAKGDSLRPFFETRTQYLGAETKFEVVPMDIGNRNLALRVKSLAFNAGITNSVLSSLSLYMLPKEWTSYVLQSALPETALEIQELPLTEPYIYTYLTQQNTSAVFLGQTSDPGWVAINMSNLLKSPVKIERNGWEQGFLLEGASLYLILYLPNFLGWIGFILIFAMLAFFIFRKVLLRRLR